MSEVLYSKVVTVLLTRESTARHEIHLAIHQQSQLRSRSYRIQLTDPNDYFFLYEKSIDEDCYNSIKSEQQLSIDFLAFPAALIELLSECTLDEPSKRLELSVQTLRASLSIVEPRKFRNITELKLDFQPADDTAQKKYLASSLQSVQNEYRKEIEIKEDRISQLQKQLTQTTRHLGKRECEELRNRGDIKLEEVKLSHEAEKHEWKKTQLRIQEEASHSQERKIKDLEQNFERQTRKLEVKINELERSRDENAQKRVRAENTVREQKMRIDSLMQEKHRFDNEQERNQEQRSALDKEAKGREEQIFTLKSELAVKNQELSEIRSNLSRLDHQSRTTVEQKLNLEEKLQKIQVQCHRLEKDNQQLMSDLGKANEIIQRKMEENRTFKDKYRRNTELIKKQEKLLQDKDEDIKKLACRIKEKEDESRSVSDLLASNETKLQDLTERLKTAQEKNLKDDKVIDYLNKKLNSSNSTAPNPYLQKIASRNSGNFEIPSSFSNGTGKLIHVMKLLKFISRVSYE